MVEEQFPNKATGLEFHNSISTFYNLTNNVWSSHVFIDPITDKKKHKSKSNLKPTKRTLPKQCFFQLDNQQTYSSLPCHRILFIPWSLELLRPHLQHYLLLFPLVNSSSTTHKSSKSWTSKIGSLCFSSIIKLCNMKQALIIFIFVFILKNRVHNVNSIFLQYPEWSFNYIPCTWMTKIKQLLVILQGVSNLHSLRWYLVPR